MAATKTPVTETKTVSEARRTFSETLDRVRESDVRVVVEKSGIPVAAVVPLSVLRESEDRERRRLDALESLRQAQAGFAGVSEEEAEREIANALDEIKQEERLARRIVMALKQAAPDLFASSESFLVSEVRRLLQADEARILSDTGAREGKGE